MRFNKKEYLIVDGYNIINSWDELKELSKTDLEHAREKLIDAIIEYAEYTGRKGIIVFDAYNIKSCKEKIEERTKEALEKSLKEYDGTMLFVSHDRYFINKLASSILYIDETGAKFYRMNYQDYLDRNKPQELNIKAKSVEKNNVKQEVKRNINYSREIKKIEKLIDQKEIEIESLRQLRFEPEYYHDYQKMSELDDRIDTVNNEIENLMLKWEEYSELLEG